MSTLISTFEQSAECYPNNCCLIWYDGKDCCKYTYGDILKTARIICHFLKRNNVPRYCTIGIYFKTTKPILIPLILGVQLGEAVFMCLREPFGSEIIQYNVEYILKCTEESSKSKLEYYAQVDILEIEIFNSTIQLWTLENIGNTSDIGKSETDNRIAYCIQTSGSTGVPKYVSVPDQCIMPNIIHLSEIFAVTSQDRMYLGTPPTFDPFIVELFIALSGGASLIMTSEKYKHNPELLTVLFPNDNIDGVTIMQVTPSIFKLWGIDAIRNTILTESSKLRILAFGGEKCPDYEQLKIWKNCNNKTRIFNLYGITEVSCWASIHEIDVSCVGNEIPLGSALSETLLQVMDEKENRIVNGVGQIFIGSKTRKCVLQNETSCVVLDASKIIFRPTGDIGVVEDFKIYYRGRMNNVIKRYGNRVDLNRIESIVDKHRFVKESCCIWLPDKSVLVLFCTVDDKEEKISGTFSNIREHLTTFLKDLEMPDYVHQIGNFPISAHGKISKRKLEQLHLNLISIGNKTRPLFNELFYTEIERLIGKVSFNLAVSFLAHGGNSVTALQMTKKFEETYEQTMPMLISLLLNSDKSLQECLEYIQKRINEEVNSSNTQNENEPSTAILKIRMTISWKHNLEKCVDATPSLVHINNVLCVTVGSHSHLLVTLDAKSGNEISRTYLPDRIESPVCVSKCLQNGIVGCYDGCVYCVNFQTGDVKWSFQTNDMVKGKALVCNGGSDVVVGSYDGSLYCLNCETGTMVWKTTLCTKGILVTPVCSHLKPSCLFTATLAGVFACVDSVCGKTIWKKQFLHPIFSSPCVLTNNDGADVVVFAEVTGQIHCLDMNGDELWTYQADGNIYSTIITTRDDDTNPLLVFGCHDKKVYCLELKTFSDTPRLKWCCTMNSQVYSTPCILTVANCKCVAVAETMGRIYIVHLESGIVYGELDLPGEIYSSSVSYDNNIFVGCRDNHLYCVECKCF